MSGKLPVMFVCFYLVVLNDESGNQCLEITEEQSLMGNKLVHKIHRYILRDICAACMDVRYAATCHWFRCFEQLVSRPPGMLTPGRGLARR
jgi:hypothetical protein